MPGSKQKRFLFLMPITRQVIKNCRFETQHVGDLEIEGIATDTGNPTIPIDPADAERYEVNIQSVKWNSKGVNIKDIIELTDKWEELVTVATQHAYSLFNDEIQTEAA